MLKTTTFIIVREYVLILINCKPSPWTRPVSKFTELVTRKAAINKYEQDNTGKTLTFGGRRRRIHNQSINTTSGHAHILLQIQDRLTWGLSVTTKATKLSNDLSYFSHQEVAMCVGFFQDVVHRGSWAANITWSNVTGVILSNTNFGSGTQQRWQWW